LKLVVLMDNWSLMDLVWPLDIVGDMRIHGDGVVALLEVDDGEVATWKDLLGGFQRHKGVPSAMVAMSLDHNDYC